MCELESEASAIDAAALADRRDRGYGLRGSPYFLPGVSGRAADVGGSSAEAAAPVLRILGPPPGGESSFVRAGKGLTWADAQLVRCMQAAPPRLSSAYGFCRRVLFRASTRWTVPCRGGLESPQRASSNRETH